MIQESDILNQPLLSDKHKRKTSQKTGKKNHGCTPAEPGLAPCP